MDDAGVLEVSETCQGREQQLCCCARRCGEMSVCHKLAKPRSPCPPNDVKISEDSARASTIDSPRGSIQSLFASTPCQVRARVHLRSSDKPGAHQLLHDKPFNRDLLLQSSPHAYISAVSSLAKSTTNSERSLLIPMHQASLQGVLQNAA